MKPEFYGPFAYTSIRNRPRIKWPNGARLALCVIPCLEHFALDQPMPEGTRKVPDIPTWSKRDYGNRVGVFRIFDALDRHSIRATAAINSDLCDAHPEIMEEVAKREWGVIAHGESNSRFLNGMEPAEEQRAIHDALAKIESATGTRPRGWMGPGMQQTANTMEYLVAEGIEYVADWLNDDQPYMIGVGNEKLVALPYGGETHDKGVFMRLFFTPAQYQQMITDHFDVLYREGADSGRVMALQLHPYVIGVPHRIQALERALEHICSHDDVWFATGDEIVDHYLNSGATF